MPKIIGGTCTTPMKPVGGGTGGGSIVIIAENSIGEAETIAVDGKTYDGFVDNVARKVIEDIAARGGVICKQDVDTDFSETSENPVQNKVITAAMNEATQVIGELYKAIEGLQNSGGSITVDTELSATSTNPVQNKVITQVFNEAMGGLGDTIKAYVEQYIGEALGGEY